MIHLLDSTEGICQYMYLLDSCPENSPLREMQVIVDNLPEFFT